LRILIFDILAILAVYFGAGAVFDVRQRINNLKSNKIINIILNFTYWLFLPILIFLAYQSFVSGIFGVKEKPLVEYICNYSRFSFCSAVSDSTEAKQFSFAPPTVGLTSVEVCGRALNVNRSDWTSSGSFIQYVNQAKEAGEQIDSCRIKLGLRTLDQERRDAEEMRIKGLTNLMLCQEAIPGNSIGFSNDFGKQVYVAEAHRRGFSVEDCKKIAGRTPSEITPSSNQSVLQTPKPESNVVDPNTGLSIAVVRNPSLSYSNMRAGPGTNFSIVLRLRNGIEVTVLGSKISSKGTEWCEVSIGDGTKGFVSSDFLDVSCQLTTGQHRFIEEKRREDVQQFLDATNETLKLIGKLK
jgi:Bacterial SH3 domain